MNGPRPTPKYGSIYAIGLCVGCGEPLNLGSNIIWQSDHESGTVGDWIDDDQGGVFVSGGGTYEVATEHAHSGTHSVRLTAAGQDEEAIAALWRRDVWPTEAYHSARFFIPTAVTTVGYWTIMRLCSGPMDEPDPRGVDLNLRSLADGRLVLEVMHNRLEYLKLPLADPTPFVPIGAWFHVEVRLLCAIDETGYFDVWLDDRLVYEVHGRATAEGDDLYWATASIGNQFAEGSATLYVDDAVVSLSRVGKNGTLKRD